MDTTAGAPRGIEERQREALAVSRRLAPAIDTGTNGKRAGTASHEDEQYYRELVEAVDVAVYTTDAAGRITFFNEAAAELWGRRPEVGKDLWCGSWRIYHVDGTPMPHDQCPMAITLKENRPVRGAEAIAERPDGTRVFFTPFPTPLRDESGALVGAVNVLVDITARKQAEEEAERERELVHTITDTVSVGVFMLDEHGRIEYMNPAAERITGYSFEEIRGEVAHEKLHYLRGDGSPFPKSECPIHSVTDKPQRLIGHEDVFVRPDGSLYNVVRNITPVLRAGAKIKHVIDLRDATDEKRAEEAIRQSIEVKDEFLGLVSHELRTPIATIVGNAQILWRRNEALSAEDKQQSLGDIVTESEKLQRIIENLLLLTRLDAGQSLETEPLRLPPLIAQTVASYQRRNPQRSVSVTSEGEIPIVLGQPAVLTLVLENLIANADKYSTPESPIEIRLCANDGKDVEVCVRDWGIGLEENETEEVFAPFYRSERAKTVAKGIGLGLAVCKRVIEAQGGTIRAVTRPEGGCDFVFTLRPASDGSA
jgi:PAS domain S-box-containing protein